MRTLKVMLIGFFVAGLSVAEVKKVRWTYQEDRDADLAHIVQVVNEKTGLKLTTKNFLLIENRPLATSYFQMYVQQAGRPGVIFCDVIQHMYNHSRS